MDLLESSAAPIGGKRAQRRAYGWASRPDDEPTSSVLEMLPMHLNDYEMDAHKDSLFLNTENDYEMDEPNDSLFLETEEDGLFAEDLEDRIEEEEAEEPLIPDNTQADVNEMRGAIEESESLTHDNTQVDFNVSTGALDEDGEPLIQDNTQAEVNVNTSTILSTTAKPSEEDISSRRRSRRVLDKISKQEELMERVTKILAETDVIFHQFTPTQRDTVTVRDVVQLIEESLSWSLSKDEKKQVRGRLTELNTTLVVSQQETAATLDNNHESTLEEPDNDAEMEPTFDRDDSDYDYDEHKLKKKKAVTSRKQNSTRKRSHKRQSVSSDSPEKRKKKKSKLNPKDFALDQETEPQEEPDGTSSSTKKRKPAHLKIHLDMKKKREAKIREEEVALKKKENEKVNEKDRVLAQLIARKFETDNEELRIQRTEDRLNLLERLEKRRWGVLHSSCEIDGLDVPLSSLQLQSKKSIPTVAGPMEQKEDHIMQETESSSSEGEYEDTDEEELEFVGSAPPNFNPTASAPPPPPPNHSVPARQISPKSIMDFFGIQKQVPIKQFSDGRNKANAVVSRSALIKMLRVKQIQAGNQWLARELGHDKPEDHIRECMNAMKTKRNIILQKEEGRRSIAAERKVWMQQVLDEQQNETGKLDSQDVIHQKRSLLSDENNLDVAEDENIDDDELALARKLEREKELISDGDSDQDELDDSLDYRDEGENFDDSSPYNVGETLHNEDDDSLVPDKDLSVLGSGSEVLVNDFTQNMSQSFREDLVADNTQTDPPAESNIPVVYNTHQKETAIPLNSTEEEEREFDEVVETSKELKSTVKKNAAWKAMLLKEAEQARKQKKMRALRDGLVEAEAEEEEEEEGIAGLEDFGFTIGAKKKSDDDEEENDEIMDDDFDNVVDELSDNEGDEDEGEKARKAFERKEEMERLKEIKRRVREGYDGRREGIAGGVGSARGVHRFDQLVAADDYKEAKRLGLQNDDESENESNSVSESKDNQGEIDDENALIDKAIKERHLKRVDLPENFSDDDDDEEEEDMEDGVDEGEKNSDDEDDREQERLAKRFAKRARMNRLLDMYNGESQFSRSRLLDEDVTLQRDLKAIKNAHAKTSRNVSVGSLFNTVMSSQLSVKRSISHGTVSTESQQSNTSIQTVGAKSASCGSKLSLRINNNTDRSKTSFLGRAKALTSMSRSSRISK